MLDLLSVPGSQCKVVANSEPNILSQSLLGLLNISKTSPYTSLERLKLRLEETRDGLLLSEHERRCLSYAISGALSITAEHPSLLPYTEILLKYGKVDIADEEDLASGLTVLQKCVSHGNYVMVEALLRSGANPNAKNQRFETTALHIGTLLPDSTPFIDLLCSYKANPNVQNKLGQTPLHLSVLGKREVDSDTMRETCKLLLEHGANPNIRDNDGDTAMHYLSSLLDRGLYNLAADHSSSCSMLLILISATTSRGHCSPTV